MQILHRDDLPIGGFSQQRLKSV